MTDSKLKQLDGESLDDFKARLNATFSAKTNNILKAIIGSMNIDTKLTYLKKKDLVDLIIDQYVRDPQLTEF